MKSETKILGVMAAFAVMLAGIAVICDTGDTTEGATYIGAGTQANPYTKIDCTGKEFFDKYLPGSTIYLDAGCTVKITDFAQGNEYYYVESAWGKPKLGMATSGTQFGGTATAGTSVWYAVLVDDSVGESSETPINVVVIPDTYTVTYNAAGGTSASPASVVAGQSTSLPSTTRSGYVFNGWYTAASGGTLVGNAGDSYTPSASVTLYAHWSSAACTISSTAGDFNKVTGQGWSYVVTATPADATITVEGASWLSVTGKVISGTVGPAGDYTITVKASKAGYTQAVQTFTIHVVSELTFLSNPTSGFIIMG